MAKSSTQRVREFRARQSAKRGLERCWICREPLEGKRFDAKFCSEKCRSQRRRNAKSLEQQNIDIATQRYSSRRFTAYHEAGHAVIGLALGLKCHGVRIIPATNSKKDREMMPWLSKRNRSPGDALGLAQVEDGSRRATALMLFAGAIAEKEAFPQMSPLFGVRGGEKRKRRYMHYDGGFGGDSDSDGSLLAKLDPTQAERHRWYYQARALVQKHFPAIARVANSLIKQGMLRKDEIEALIKASAG
jgi:hypothetical protein